MVCSSLRPLGRSFRGVLRAAAVLLLALLPALALSSVRLPKGEWRLSNTDLRVATPRGVIAVERTLQSGDLNKLAYCWHPKPAWQDLKFELDDAQSISA